MSKNEKLHKDVVGAIEAGNRRLLDELTKHAGSGGAWELRPGEILDLDRVHPPGMSDARHTFTRMHAAGLWPSVFYSTLACAAEKEGFEELGSWGDVALAMGENCMQKAVGLWLMAHGLHTIRAMHELAHGLLSAPEHVHRLAMAPGPQAAVLKGTDVRVLHSVHPVDAELGAHIRRALFGHLHEQHHVAGLVQAAADDAEEALALMYARCARAVAKMPDDVRGAHDRRQYTRDAPHAVSEDVREELIEALRLHLMSIQVPSVIGRDGKMVSVLDAQAQGHAVDSMESARSLLGALLGSDEAAEAVFAALEASAAEDEDTDEDTDEDEDEDEDEDTDEDEQLRSRAFRAATGE